MTAQEVEQSLAYNLFLEDYFYEGWRKGDSHKKLELIFSPKCDLACRYCYCNKHWHKLYPDKSFAPDVAIANAEKIITWLARKNLRCDIDIFSGELFSQQAGYDLLDMMLRFYKKTPEAYRPKCISIPTNFIFVCDDVLRNRVIQIIGDFDRIGIRLLLSASFDGKFMEENRPYKGNLDLPIRVERDDAYYDRAFEFVKQYGSGFHPMVYSKNIGQWKKNFDWFQDMLAKFDMPWDRLYLLQVRNAEWSVDDCVSLKDFIKHIVRYEFEKTGTAEKYWDHLYNTRYGGFNIIHASLFSNPRGLSCSIQTTLPIRVSDLKVYPCHRTMYDQFEIAKFSQDANGDLVDFEAGKSALAFAVYGCDFRNFPLCLKCPMKGFCVGGCLGSQYESTGSMFVPIPTVCQANFYIHKGILEAFRELGIESFMVDRLGKNYKELRGYIDGANV